MKPAEIAMRMGILFTLSSKGYLTALKTYRARPEALSYLTLLQGKTIQELVDIDKQLSKELNNALETRRKEFNSSAQVYYTQRS